MNKVKEKQKGVFDSMDLVVPDDLTCKKCGKTFKAFTGYKSHYVFKHTNFKVKRNKQVDRSRQERLADLTIEAIKSGESFNKKELLALSGYTGATLTKTSKEPFNSAGFQDALARRGINMDSIAEVLEEASRAKQGSWFQGEYYQDEAPDHGMRIKAVKELGDLMGVKKRVIEQRSVNVNLTGEDLKGMLGLG